MDTYTHTSGLVARLFTKQYSTSFYSASKLFPYEIRTEIFNVYGLVRIADEIVDSYKGRDQSELLSNLEQDCYVALSRGYSVNPVVHAFALTAAKYKFPHDQIAAFFASMRMDLSPQVYTQELYEKYIHGSAEVVGLLCLRIFVAGNEKRYSELSSGAMNLGSAFQKVNFLRDMQADWQDLKRFYFPGTSFQLLDDTQKEVITTDIRHDFLAAKPYIWELPKSVQPAVMTSFKYFEALLKQLEATPVTTIKTTRIRLSAFKKATILGRQAARIRR